ncbi:lysine--tRNA ligase [Aestuariivirga sp.]|uniref:lysine--tRNA ligase n=1 Tax=Aestuariivirga sp. TaxID=2650926 RepID=UPI003593E3CA
MTADPVLRAAAETSKAWPFEEARKLVARVKRTGKTEVLFETGYGPSGLPHIGTFGEVARTTMVRRAFELLCDVPTRLLCFSDDMDGMRKIPENVPDRSFLEPHLHRPLTSVPDPYGGYESYGHHNNAMLRRFLDTFGFQYEFASATDYYKSGKFDAMLLKALEKFDDIMAVMLPTLGEERQATYSPFLPISPISGRVLYVPMKDVNAKAGTITFTDEDGTDVTTLVTGGRTKLQWKPDFGMRWAALGVDFEMFGKDHQTNAPIYDRICEILGAEAPEHYVYELFLDDKGQKISKSKGNGLTIDEWLTYADPNSLSLFMYNKPREAKRLYFDVIPRAVDDYAAYLSAYQRQAEKPTDRLMNPAWHIHQGNPPAPEEGGISFSLLLNLAAVANAHEKSALWGFIRRYSPELSPETHPRLDALTGYALRYFDDFVKPKKQYRLPTEDEAKVLFELSAALGTLPEHASPDEIQQKVYDIGRREPYTTTQKDGSVGVAQSWFNMLYQVLLGEEKGPRFGSFVALYGIENTRGLIARAVKGELVK